MLYICSIVIQNNNLFLPLQLLIEQTTIAVIQIEQKHFKCMPIIHEYSNNVHNTRSSIVIIMIATSVAALTHERAECNLPAPSGWENSDHKDQWVMHQHAQEYKRYDTGPYRGAYNSALIGNTENTTSCKSKAI